MANDKGTLELIVGEVGTVLSPLGRDLVPARAPGLFAALGVPMTTAQAESIATSLGQVKNGIEHLLQLVNELNEAVEADETGRIIEKAVTATVKIAEVVDGFVDLADAVRTLPGVTSEVASALPERLFNYLLAEYLGRNRGLNEVLELFGILEREDFNVDATDPEQPFYTVNTFHFDRVGGWLSDPAGQLAELYDWGTPAFTGDKLLRVLDKLVALLGLPTHLDESGPSPVLDLVAFELVPKTDVTPKGLALRLKHRAVSATVELTGDDWRITLGLELGLLAGTEVVLQPNGAVSIRPPEATTVSGKVRVGYALTRTEEAPLVLLGIPGGSGLFVRELGAFIELGLAWNGSRATGEIGFGGEIKGGKAVITAGDGDGFLSTLLSGVNLENQFDLGFSYSSEHGLHFHGSSALEIQLASHIELGPIELRALTLSLGISGNELPIGIATDIKAELGPLVAVVEGLGFELAAALVEDNSGNAGPVDLRPRFKPPNGVGLSIDAGAVKGGGYLFFDFDNGEYAGILELEILKMVSAKAIGLITTKMPDGSSGFSLLIIITAEFNPAFQLGYGFTLSGIGGLLGLNRTMMLQPLREGVRTGAVNSIMFPVNPVANASQIISDLKAIFPPEDGKFLIGPMAKIGWGTPTLISVSFGLIIEIPGNIAILGVLRIALPDEKNPLVNIQVNFVGTLDFAKKLLTFDASLFDSRILVITIEGDMALRIKWGEEPNFLVSVGGFHPRYTPPPLELPAMKRLTLSILDTDWARLRAEAYQAITSNTVQFGCRVELYLGFDALYVDGYFGFDALIQFSPFYFIVEIAAGVSLHVFGIDLLSIRLQLMLEGPTPWHAKGHASVTVLFWDVSVDFDTTWGDKKDTTLPDVAVMPQLLEAVGQPNSWQGVLPPSSSLWVSTRATGTEDALVLHPSGSLRVTQKVVPLDFTFEKVGAYRPSDVNRISIAAASSGALELTLDPTTDPFAPAQYQKLSDAEKLSRPSFEPMESGVTIGSGGALHSGNAVKRSLAYEVVVIDKEARPPAVRPPKPLVTVGGKRFTAMLAGSAVGRSAVSKRYQKQLRPFDDAVGVAPERFVIAGTDDNRAVGAARFASEAAAQAHLRAQIAAQPGLAGRLHVLPEFEVQS